MSANRCPYCHGEHGKHECNCWAPDLKTQIIMNQADMLGDLIRNMGQMGHCRTCEQEFNVMDLFGGTCEQCRMNDEGRW